jgi:hypothetical protein
MPNKRALDRINVCICDFNAKKSLGVNFEIHQYKLQGSVEHNMELTEIFKRKFKFWMLIRI